MMAETAVANPPYIPPPSTLKKPPSWVKSTDVSLTFERKPSLSEWLAVVEGLKREKQSSPWRIGDALNSGEEWFPEEYAQAIDPNEEADREETTGETFLTYQRVAKRIEPRRRLRSLSWSHHQVVAYLDDPNEADAYLLFCLKEREAGRRVSVHKLRKLLRESAEAERGDVEERKPDLVLLQDPKIRAWLEKDMEEQRAKDKTVPVECGYFHSLIGSRIGQSQWQLDRTLPRDLMHVRYAVKATTGSHAQIYKFMTTRSWFMSDGDFEDYLDALVADMRVKRKPMEGRKEGQKGGMTVEHYPVRNPMDNDKEDDDDYY